MTHLFHRQLHAVLPVAVAGDGPYLIDDAGRRYLDASGGAAVSCLGHSNAAVRAAICEQASRLAYAHTGFFSSKPAEDLGDFLVDAAPDGLAWVYFTSGGSEAVETAMKLARQYAVANGQPERTRFIARNRSYHGNTLGALALGQHKGRRAAFEPLLIDVARVSPCYAYREQAPDEDADGYAARLAAELEAKILAVGPETVCAFVAETVSGASLGAVPPVRGYFKAIREICDKYEILLVLDEIMCGMGRTGTLFACEQDGVVPDLLTVAKGLGAGYQPLGAVMVSKTVYQAIDAAGSGFVNGYTYMGHPTACAAGLAVQRQIRDLELLSNIRRQGAALKATLQTRFSDNEYVGDIRGRGLFIGVELVADQDTKAPFDPAVRLAERIKTRAMDIGLMCYPGGGGADGRAGDHILLAPPFIIDDGHVADIVEMLGQAVDGALADVGAAS